MSSFDSVCDKLVSLTTENREVSSVKSFELELRPSDKSLMYIRERRGPNIEPWETPSVTSFQDNR